MVRCWPRLLPNSQPVQAYPKLVQRLLNPQKMVRFVAEWLRNWLHSDPMMAAVGSMALVQARMVLVLPRGLQVAAVVEQPRDWQVAAVVERPRDWQIAAVVERPRDWQQVAVVVERPRD